MRQEFGKLVRDRIPEIIVANGEKAIYRTLSDEEYRTALLEKLSEEVEEVKAASPKEITTELADVLEVLHAIASLHNVSFDSVREERDTRREKRGGFERKIYLEATE